MSRVLTIVRSGWIRGGDPDTRMRTADGRMCCLGFDAVACGVPPDEIVDLALPNEIHDLELFPEYAASRSYVRQIDGQRGVAVPVLQASYQNDNPAISEPEREAAIRESLMALGWSDVRFVD